MRFAIIWMIHLTWEHDSNLCSIIRTPYFVCKFQIAFLTIMHILNAKIERSASEISCFNNLSHVQFCVSMKHIGIQQLQNWLFSLFISIRIAAFVSIYICISPICRMKRLLTFYLLVPNQIPTFVSCLMCASSLRLLISSLMSRTLKRKTKNLLHTRRNKVLNIHSEGVLI